MVANAGGSNTGDGQRGIDTARATQAAAAEALGIAPEQVGLASTGVIAAELPRDKVAAGARARRRALGDSAEGLAQAIMTTDRWPKRACLEVELEGGSVRLAGQAKGAGMISPRYATMFCFVETDAALRRDRSTCSTGRVREALVRPHLGGRPALDERHGVRARERGVGRARRARDRATSCCLGEAIDALMRQLAIEIVADGEGARRVGRIVVRGRHRPGRAGGALRSPTRRS